MKHSLIYPMAAYIFYIWCVATYMFRSRVRGIKSGAIQAKYFKTYQGAEPPERLILIADHYQNQFEVPVLFMITCTVFIAQGTATSTTVALAWFFVLTRGMHAWVHLGRNNLKKRVMAFAAGWLTLLAMWVQLLIG